MRLWLTLWTVSQLAQEPIWSDRDETEKKKKKKRKTQKEVKFDYDFCKLFHWSALNEDQQKYVCLCWGFMASQPSRVMSSTVSLPNHTFTRQA